MPVISLDEFCSRWGPDRVPYRAGVGARRIYPISRVSFYGSVSSATVRLLLGHRVGGRPLWEFACWVHSVRDGGNRIFCVFHCGGYHCRVALVWGTPRPWYVPD